MTQLDSIISRATKQNWRRLGVLQNTNCNSTEKLKNSTQSPKLVSRANKKLSQKNIIPVEYFCCVKNIAKIQTLIDLIIAKHYNIADCLYSFALNLLAKKQILHRKHTQTVLKDFEFKVHKDLLELDLPQNESDILGIIYQCFLREGEKNKAGAYYTPQNITQKMTQNLAFDKKQTFLDPCCGSGAFLLALKNANPNQIYGIDSDPLAVFIAKINLLLKFSEFEFMPQIYLANFLRNELFNTINQNLPNKFDYIITNPPWGVVREKNVSSERFSLFFMKSYEKLKENGLLQFLLPNAILNVKAHKQIRKFMLENGTLKSIYFYNANFNAVTTKFVDITQIKTSTKSDCSVAIYKENEQYKVPKSSFYYTKNLVFNALKMQDIQIIKSVKEKAEFSLDKSTFALGIVTGDNKNKLTKTAQKDYEKIYTGKEIMPYTLKEASHFIFYDRDNLQQVASDAIYRAKEKLVYKFISKRLIFAYDDSGSLFLNSANILIPNIPNMSIKTALAFLNSKLYQYLYFTLFQEIKILRGNLEELPFLNLNKSQDVHFSRLIDEILNGNENAKNAIDDEIYKLFKLNTAQQKHIEKALNADSH